MRITFIRPNATAERAADAMPPLAFAVLAGLTPDDVEVSLIDERVEPLLPGHIETDLAAISIETFTACRGYKIADAFRARGLLVVVGGYHPTALPEEAAEHADAVVIGSAESVWPEVVDDARRGQLQSVYRGAAAKSLAGVCYPREIFAGKRYTPVTPVELGRGCKFTCDFCSVSAFHRGRHVARSVDEVVAEIKTLPGRYLLFIDDNIYADEPLARELFRQLAGCGRRWGCQISLDVAEDEETLALMQRAGCVVALVGFESFDAGNLAQMGKTGRVAGDDYPAAIAAFKAHGIMVYGSFVFGYDGDNLQSVAAVTDFAVREKLFLANFNTLNPMPGTRLYRRLAAEDRLPQPAWWLDPKNTYGEVLFEPLGFGSRDELKQAGLAARYRFFSAQSIATRALDWTHLSHLPLYFGANVIARREMQRKMRRLGVRNAL